MGQYVLALDCGSQSLRAIVFNKEGQMLAKVKKVFDKPYFSKQPGWKEQEADFYYHTLCQVCLKMKESKRQIFNAIDTIALTTQRDTCIIVDKNGKPLRPAILYSDERKIKNHRPIKLPQKTAALCSGMYSTVLEFNKNCKAHWIMEHEPELWRKTYKYILLSTYLNYKLTGKFIDSLASQIGHIPFNYKKFRWEGANGIKRQIFQIPRTKLCDLVKSGEIIGSITKQAATDTGLREGLRVIAAGSDKGCETLGVGCIAPSTATISLGTHATVQTTTKKYYELMRFIPPFPAVIPDTYNPEVQIYRGFWMITWFKKEFAMKEMEQAKDLGISPEELLNQRLKEVPPGSEGLVLQPYWGVVLKNREAKGSIIGFSDNHIRIHIYRAIIEGIGYALYNGMKKIEKKSGYSIKRMMISGGGSQSDMICQITADLFNKIIYRVQTYETSALGASIIGYVARGDFKTYEEAIHHMVHVKDRFIPNSDNVAIYQQLYSQIYDKIYANLKPLYIKLKKILDM